MKTRLILLIGFLSILTFPSCKKDPPDQEREQSIIQVNPTSLLMRSIASKDSIDITANTSWTLLRMPNWLTANQITGNGNSKVYLTAQANTSTTSRNAVITLKGEEDSVLITVNQDQPEVTIYALMPPQPLAGGEYLTIHGTGYSATSSENIVRINNAVATVITATTTQLKVQVPYGAGPGDVIVTVNAKADTAHGFVYKWTANATIIAGGVSGYADGTGVAAQFVYPCGLDLDAAGNLFVADYGNSKIRKITQQGVVSTLPGRFPAWNFPTGPNTDFGLPSDVKLDKDGNLYVVEFNSSAISKISASGQVTLITGGTASGFVDGPVSSALFYRTISMEIDGSDNLIIVDRNNHAIRKITPQGIVSTIAGGQQGYSDGTGPAAKFNNPNQIVMVADGSFLITDYYNNYIRKMTSQGVVTTYAGTGSHTHSDGTLLTAGFYQPRAIATSSTGDIYFSDSNGKLRWITPQGQVRTINTNIELGYISGIVVGPNGVLYVSEENLHRISKIETIR